MTSLLLAAILAGPTAWPKVVALPSQPALHESMAPCVIQLGGKTVILGGYSYPERTCLTSVDLVDSEGRSERAAVKLKVGRNFFGAVPLGPGRVVVLGGYCEGADTLTEVECVDIGSDKSESWAPLFHPVELAATVSLSGKIAVIGGLTSQGDTQTWDCIQLVDIISHEVNLNKATLRTSRFGHGVAQLRSGEVLIVGGKHVDRVPKKGGGTRASYRALASIEAWNPSTGLIRGGGSLTVGRDRPALYQLADGKVLILGGQSNQRVLSSIELYDPSTQKSRVIAQMAAPRMAAQVLPFGSKGLLISGGWTDNPDAGRAIEYMDLRTLTLRTLVRAKVCRAEHAMVWLKRDEFALLGGKDAFKGRNPHRYHFQLTERFRISL